MNAKYIAVPFTSGNFVENSTVRILDAQGVAHPCKWCPFSNSLEIVAVGKGGKAPRYELDDKQRGQVLAAVPAARFLSAEEVHGLITPLPMLTPLPFPH